MAGPSPLAIATVRKHIFPTCRSFRTVQSGDKAISDNNRCGHTTHGRRALNTRVTHKNGQTVVGQSRFFQSSRIEQAKYLESWRLLLNFSTNPSPRVLYRRVIFRSAASRFAKEE